MWDGAFIHRSCCTCTAVFQRSCGSPTHGSSSHACFQSFAGTPWKLLGSEPPRAYGRFVAGIVFAIGQRILPALCGMRILWIERLMGWSLCLLFPGCLIRVSAEPLAYEGI